MSSLLAAIPYSLFTFGPFTLLDAFKVGGSEIGPFQIHSFGLFVAIGLFVAFAVGSRYTEKTIGESGIEFQNFGILLVIVGWCTAHVIDVVFYRPEELAKDPMLIFKVWGSISSYGGLFGGILGAWIWRFMHPEKDFLAYCDIGAMSLTYAWMFGRFGCASVHDHPGKITDFPLAIEWPNGVIRHDLGFYEAIWWIVICITVFISSRKPRPRGFFLALVPLMYAPVRFGLDFLRVGPDQGGDVRYFGLTPAQYFSMIIFIAGLYFFNRVRKNPPVEPVRFVPSSAKNDEDAKYYKSNKSEKTPKNPSDDEPSEKE